jgi:peptidoglycan/LPS O-acetylase OafA/YrhL
MVFFHHLIYDGKIPWKVAHLYTGFIIFFVLSGFLITFHNFDKVVDGVFSFREYFIRRFARIYPAYLLVFFVTAYIQIVPEQDSLAYWVLNISLLKGWSHKYIYSGVGQAWTLTVEESFYALAPLIFYLLGKKNIWLLGICAASLVLGLVHWSLGFLNPNNPHFTRDLYSLSMNGFFFMVLPFASGIWGALVFMGQRKGAWAKNSTYLALAAVIACLAALEIAKPFDAPFWYFSYTQTFVVLAALPLATSWLLISLSSEKSALATFLASGPMDLLGRASYLVYLLHTGIIAASLWTWLEGYTTGWTTMAFIILMNLLCIVLYKIYEEPAATLIRKFSSSFSATKSDN